MAAHTGGSPRTLLKHALKLILVGVAATVLVACRAGGDGSTDRVTAVICQPPAEPTDYQSAFRLLKQASFGPNRADLDYVMANGPAAWLDCQLSMSSAYSAANDSHRSHLQRLIQVATAVEPGADWFPTLSEDVSPQPEQVFFDGSASRFTDELQMGVWFENALHGRDQLRQRVAYALSQILVTSAREFPLGDRAEALAFYYDILARNALGNFRTLIDEVARSPAMGLYLSHQGNHKANPDRNTLPDENFARELMQLFTIGLYQLNPDGTAQRDADGELIPTYDQQDIEELAKVMTGWDLRYNTRYGRSNGSYVHFMEFNPEYHEYGAKEVMGKTIPANLQSGADLSLALDMLFEHPNTAPFISRQLIQRLVSSNPSPAYVGRVAAVFADNGKGERGDLGAVVRAILLDEEARHSTDATPQAFGRAEEHLLAYTAFLRAFNVQPINGWQLNSDNGNVPVNGIYYFSRIDEQLGQGPLRAPSVFNFYDPYFSPQDSFYNEAAPERVLPEMQLRSPNNIAALYDLLRADSHNLYERQYLTTKHGSVEAFVAEQNTDGRWNWRPAIALIDYREALETFEMAMEGDSDGDYLLINSSAADANDHSPKERGVHALLDFLEVRLLGAKLLGDDFREPLITQLLNDADSYYNPRNNRVTEAHRTVAGAVQYVMLSSTLMAQH